jgi:hypothetical protein
MREADNSHFSLDSKQSHSEMHRLCDACEVPALRSECDWVLPPLSRGGARNKLNLRKAMSKISRWP